MLTPLPLVPSNAVEAFRELSAPPRRRTMKCAIKPTTSDNNNPNQVKNANEHSPSRQSRQQIGPTESVVIRFDEILATAPPSSGPRLAAEVMKRKLPRATTK